MLWKFQGILNTRNNTIRIRMPYVDLYKCEELCNSNGRCYQKNPVQRSCDCDLGFTGRTCGVVDPNPAPISRFSPIPEVSAFILALSAALFLIITLVFCLQSCCIRYSKRKSVEDSSARNIQMTTRMETY
ncbi:hypothetical protein L3Y34_019685 [Caenorhabditis briggsae]|uniref:EGF-like domain-containing protein n=2 Tax=Caenorhabditis briggsae TaxID=6238 RepID=A0AAE9IWF3_CAEBR|nr:hypothetical protein L3Y34_019685 [Caenorhabditis briggsae]